jgi:hypothetical protein
VLNSRSQFGGVVYVMIVLFVLTITLPLIQVVNTGVGILFDIVVLVGSPAASAAEEKTKKENDKKRKKKAEKGAKKTRNKEAKDRKRKENKEKSEKKKKESAEKKKKKKEEQEKKKKKKREEKAKKKKEKAEKKKEKADAGGGANRDNPKTPEEALKRLEARMDRLDRRLTRAALSSYSGMRALRDFTIRELEELRLQARASVKADITLFDGLSSIRRDVRARDIDNMRSDIIALRSIELIRSRVSQLEAQLRAAMARVDAAQSGRGRPRTFTRRTGDAVAGGLFSSIYTSAVARVFGQSADYGEVTTTTSDESSDGSEYDGDSRSGDSDSADSTSSDESDESDESHESEDDKEQSARAAPSLSLVGVDIPPVTPGTGSVRAGAYTPSDAELRGMRELERVV